MSAKEVNFTFDGLHCLRDFGCIYIESGKSRIVTPEMSRPAYEIAGVNGTILLDDRAVMAAYKLSGELVPMETPRSMAEAQALARRISAWLKRGRAPLCWDYEPFHMHYAEVTGATSWSTQLWLDGGLAFDFIVQPGTYDLTPATAQAEITTSAALYIPVSTDIPCPVNLEITNTGNTAIRRIKITTPDGKGVELARDMSLASGDMLEIHMEPPIGATVTSNGVIQSALRYALQFDQLLIGQSGNLRIEIDGSAIVKATARGCAL